FNPERIKKLVLYVAPDRRPKPFMRDMKKSRPRRQKDHKELWVLYVFVVHFFKTLKEKETDHIGT
ncbi:MAG TPA: hypothetical protein VKX33_05995, partial [Cyclobacteriaceae bacterium]|nr:hypothetical protein [Cyclobacteriaceae bacterium]